MVGLLPGLSAARSVLILAGLTTHGTHAAVEFVCRPKKAEELLTALGGSIIPFEALLRVKVSGGVSMRTDIVAVRRHVPR